MEPQLPAPHSSPEMSPLSQGENASTTPKSAEQLPRHAPERQPVVETREVKTQPGGGSAPTASPPLPPVVIPAAQPTDDGQSNTADNQNPVAAADDDLIEKEWVNRAKEIVATTKTDPYLQEKEVSKLQADYLKKRWGKEINVSSD